MEERTARQLDRFLWPLCWRESTGTGKLKLRGSLQKYQGVQLAGGEQKNQLTADVQMSVNRNLMHNSNGNVYVCFVSTPVSSQ